jgi:hypothetical protein
LFIDVWYDRYTNSWVTQLKDHEETQIGEADYVHSKREALAIAMYLRKENENCITRIYSRNGELQK